MEAAWAAKTDQDRASLLPAVRELLSGEQEYRDLPAVRRKGFEARGEEERLDILACIAGHVDAATLELARLALADKSIAVQRQGLLRLLPFALSKTKGLLADYLKMCPAELKPLAETVAKELKDRQT